MRFDVLSTTSPCARRLDVLRHVQQGAPGVTLVTYQHRVCLFCTVLVPFVTSGCVWPCFVPRCCDRYRKDSLVRPKRRRVIVVFRYSMAHLTDNRCLKR